MSELKYNPDVKEALDGLLLDIPGVKPGRMFGYPAYYVSGKMFACAYGDGVGLKLPAPLAAELLAKPGVSPFVPLGRREMKEWVFILRDEPEQYSADLVTFETSYTYVATLVAAPGAGKPGRRPK